MEFKFNEIFEKMMKDHKLYSVVILGHMNPDGDAAGSVMGLAHYLNAVYPQYAAIPYLAETLDKGPKSMVDTDCIFEPFQVPKVSRYAVIVCDTATEERIIGREIYEKAEVSMVIDHHASDKGYADVNYVKISESCAENIFHILDWERWEESTERIGDMKDLHPTAADYIYLGLIHDTACFTRAKSSTFRAAEQLLKHHVDHNYIVKTMKTATLEDERRRAFLFSLTESAYDGKVAYVMLHRPEIEKYKITYEDIHPFSAILRDCQDIELGFTMYEEEPDLWRCSFRSDGSWIDVNELMDPFGGGGHAGAAGLRKASKDPDKLREEILQRLKELRRE